MKTRTGKIARLPRDIREQLNQRLADGMPGEALLDWLHLQPAVLEVLVRHFEGRPILKQNLSEWRQGGFRDWEARQERLEQVRLLCEEAEEVQEAASGLPDRLSDILATRYASLMAATAKVKDWSKPRQRAQLLELGEAIGTLQRFNQGAARLKLEREELEMKKEELRLAQEAQKQRTDEEWREWTKSCMDAMLNDCRTEEEALRGILILLRGHSDEELIRAEGKKWREKAGIPPPKEDGTLLDKAGELLKTHALQREKTRQRAQGDQTESSLIKPDLERLENEGCEISSGKSVTVNEPPQRTMSPTGND